MSIQTIEVGDAPNDGTGDSLRAAMIKINAMFGELYPDLAAAVSAIALRATLLSPTFAGVPAAPTAAPGTNTTQLANTAFVSAAIAALVNSSPGTLDTLNELAAALGNDANFATSMANALAGKAGLNLANVFTKGQTCAPVINATAAGAITPNLSLSNSFQYTLTGNLTLANPSNPADGEFFSIRLKWGGVGGYSLTLPSKFKFSGGAPDITTTVGTVALISGYYCATDDRYECGYLDVIE